MKVFVVLAVVFVAVSAVQDLQACRGNIKPLPNDAVSIGGCDKPPCLLKRKTNVPVAFKFKPDEDAKNCRTSVFGIIAGIPLPFLGVDDTDCCPDIYNTKGEKVGCPMKAGEEYEYRTEIKILQVYPKVNVVVEWQLLTGNRKNLMCFQVPARIN